MQMRHPTSVLLLTTLLALPINVSQAQAAQQVVSAADLKSECENSESIVCSAYISGYAQGFYYSSVSAQTGFTPCLAQGLSEPKARLITTKFMDEHPEVMAQGAASVIAEALVSAFPCANSR
jgi:Rap1a immunity proteins